MFRASLRLCLLLFLGATVGCAGVKAAGSDAGATGVAAGGGTSGGILTGSGGAALSNGGGRDAVAPTDGANNCAHLLNAAVRDFRGGEENGKPQHPDFEQAVVDDRGFVAAMLGGDSKPVYVPGPNGKTPTTTGKDDFDQWYRDVPGVNAHVDVTIPLTEDPTRAGVFLYDNDAFFPIDKMGLMDASSNSDHNHDFTVEMHFQFPYRGGEVFNFRGDDDVFVFINGHLAVDLGGIHIGETGNVDLDARAGELGIAVGSTYQMDVFYADRRCCGSTFHVETTLQCITNIHID